MVDFEAAVDAWCDAVEAKAGQVFRGIAEAALQRVKELTPVDTGLLRSAWSITAGEDPTPILGKRAGRQAGTAADLPALGLDLQRVALGDVLRVVNPTVYARAVEYGRAIEKKDGTTVHVPGRGMLTQTVAELPEIAEQVIADVAGRR